MESLAPAVYRMFRNLRAGRAFVSDKVFFTKSVTKGVKIGQKLQNAAKNPQKPVETGVLLLTTPPEKPQG
ncbi:hypothetical protein [Silvibacterium sp.]|uniref:hypothetical protein n=1 Tax=Silvibacterium sp. TaxID=1964179 RepID=UPI0039E25915